MRAVATLPLPGKQGIILTDKDALPRDYSSNLERTSDFPRQRPGLHRCSKRAARRGACIPFLIAPEPTACAVASRADLIKFAINFFKGEQYMLKKKLAAGVGALVAALASPVAFAHHHIEILGVSVGKGKLVATVLVTAALMVSIWRLRQVEAPQRGGRR